MAAFHAREQVGEHLRWLRWEQAGDQVMVSEYRSHSRRGIVNVSVKGPISLRYRSDYEPDLPAGELLEAILSRRPLAEAEALELAGLSPQAERWSD